MSSNERLVASLESALEARPDDVDLRIHLGRLLLLLGRVEDACGQAEEVLRLQPGNREAQELYDDAQSPGQLGEPPTPTEGTGQPGPTESSSTVDGLRLTMDDVAGLTTVKQRLEVEFLAPARNPDLAARYGKSARGGLLLFGPPGCGKTYVARCLAGELGATFMAVDSATVVSAYPGQSASNITGLFGEARRRAPCLLFFDEVDAIAPRRSGLRGAEWLKGMVNQFLSEFDGFADNTGVFVVGATNAPWDVDPAMRRPGRFDRTVAVLPPDAEARAAIIEKALHELPVGNIDVQTLARDTEGFSGADVVYTVREAASETFEKALETGKEVTLDTQTIRRAAAGIQPSVRSWMEEAKNHVLFANQDGTLDDLADWMRLHRML